MLRPVNAVPFARMLAPVLLFAVLTGCATKPEEVAVKPSAPKGSVPLAEVELKSYKPNEAGAIMIVMYHRIDPKKPNKDLNRTPEQFRKDLEALYKRGYRPVTVSEIVENKMDLPPGKSPIALTFDDALPTQFRIITGRDGLPHIDPDCAVGIIESFNKAHKDWPTKATFFVLPKEGRSGDPFGQAGSVQDKFDYLIKHGYEIGNHTATHAYLNRLNAARVRWEIATAVRDIRQINPMAQMKSLAIPYGKLPKKDARGCLISGEDGGTRYENRAILMASWRPVGSPICKIGKRLGDTVAPYDPHRLERITPDPTQQIATFEYWLKYFDDNPGERYVSDGSPLVVAVPKGFKSRVDEARMKQGGKLVQFYSLSGGRSTDGGQSGSGLTVE